MADHRYFNEDSIPSLKSVLEEEPDYENWEKAKGYLPLNDAICYAIGIYPHPSVRARWSEIDGEKYDTLFKRATGAILQGGLEAEEVKDEHYVSKTSFYEWVTAQEELLAPAFLDRPPHGTEFPLNIRNERVQQEMNKLAAKFSSAGKKWTKQSRNLCKKR